MPEAAGNPFRRFDFDPTMGKLRQCLRGDRKHYEDSSDLHGVVIRERVVPEAMFTATTSPRHDVEYLLFLL